MSIFSDALADLLPEPRRVIDAESVGGGCISQAWKVNTEPLKAGRRETLFVKRNSASMAENFQCEADGLAALASVGEIGVPLPIANGVHQQHAYLILPWVESVPPRSGFFAEFGRRLAGLHRASVGDELGWPHDNYLGSAAQKNSPADSWTEFVAENRIGFQIRWAVDQDLADEPLRMDCERIIRSLPELLSGREDILCLLHGDLWSGNYLCEPSGAPVLIDPAVYRGCREAEWGMIRLFGGCPSEFTEAYQATWAMPDGWQRRSNVYVLYHLLNHLNLFGTGYLGQCRTLAAEILSSTR